MENIYGTYWLGPRAVAEIKQQMDTLRLCLTMAGLVTLQGLISYVDFVKSKHEFSNHALKQCVLQFLRNILAGQKVTAHGSNFIRRGLELQQNLLGIETLSEHPANPDDVLGLIFDGKNFTMPSLDHPMLLDLRHRPELILEFNQEVGTIYLSIQGEDLEKNGFLSIHPLLSELYRHFLRYEWKKGEGGKCYYEHSGYQASIERGVVLPLPTRMPFGIRSEG